MTDPNCRKAFTAPVAMPARSVDTLTSAAAVLGAATSPQAAPKTTNSHHTWVYGVSGRRVARPAVAAAPARKPAVRGSLKPVRRMTRPVA